MDDTQYNMDDTQYNMDDTQYNMDDTLKAKKDQFICSKYKERVLIALNKYRPGEGEMLHICSQWFKEWTL